MALCPPQVWQCGGSVEVLPCSRIAHIERAHKPYTEDLTAHVRRNALRVAEVWMDEFKSHVYMAWNIPQEVGSQQGDRFLGGWWEKSKRNKHETKPFFPWDSQGLVCHAGVSSRPPRILDGERADYGAKACPTIPDQHAWRRISSLQPPVSSF